MKSIILQIGILIFISSLSLELKVKKSESMMEFYNNLFNQKYSLEKMKAETDLSALKKKTQKSRSISEAKKLFLRKNPNEEVKEEKNANGEDAVTKNENPDNKVPNGTEEKKGEENNSSNNPISNPPEVAYSGYQKISSKLFHSGHLYPLIKIINEEGKEGTVEVKSDSADYRINEAPLDPLLDRDMRDFYFILKDNHLYYKVDEKDLNVLYSFDLDNYNKIEELLPEWQLDATTYYCFKLSEQLTKYEYKICSKKLEEHQKLACAIANFLKTELPHCNVNQITGDIEKGSNPVIPTEIKETVEDTTIIIPLPTKSCNEKWDYLNHGDDWECLCKDGSIQSPIDLPDPLEATLSPVTPLFEFDEIPAKNQISTIDGEITKDENIKIKYSDSALRLLHHNMGKIVTLNGAVYIAEEITVHTPSEHTIKGKRFDMEIQITFYGQSKGDIAKQVVLSFLFEKKAGYYNKFIDDLDFYSLPNKHFTVRNIENNLFIPKILYSNTGDEGDELPVMKPFSFYTYDGSLTMPPCTEDTIHYVAAEPIPIGSVVLDLAREALKMPDMERIDENQNKQIIQETQTFENYRNIQNLNHRSVFYFDHKRYCGGNIDNIIPMSKPQGGHYEKIKKKIHEYIYVPGLEPSHIPHSFVVSEQEAKNLDRKVKLESNESF